MALMAVAGQYIRLSQYFSNSTLHLRVGLGVEVARTTACNDAAHLHEALAVPPVLVGSSDAFDFVRDVCGRDLCLAMCEHTRLGQRLAVRQRDAHAVADGVDTRELRLHGAAVHRDPAGVWGEPGGHQQSRHLVPGDIGEVVELGLQVAEFQPVGAAQPFDRVLGEVADVLARQQFDQLRRDLLAGHGHGPGLRGVDRDLGACAVLLQAGLPEHRGFVGGRRALERHGAHEHGQPFAGRRGTELANGLRTGRAVEVVAGGGHVIQAGHVRGCAQGDEQPVGLDGAGFGGDRPVRRVDGPDRAALERNAFARDAGDRHRDLRQFAGAVHHPQVGRGKLVLLGLVDQQDLVLAPQAPGQHVRRRNAADAGSQDDDAHGHVRLP
jgi:hypothetical protein